MTGDHRNLDDVGGAALHDGVHGQTLAEAAGLVVRRAQLGDRPAAAEERRHVAQLLRRRDRARDELVHMREAGQIRVDVDLRLLARDAELLREPERADPVDDAEVHGLGTVSLVAGERLGRLAQDFGRRDPVDVLAAREGILERGLLGEVGQDPELHLRVVGREQGVALAGDKRASDLASERRPDGDVLEVGADRREPAGGRRGLAERRMEAPVGRIDQIRQGLEIRVQELRLLAPLLDDVDDGVQLADLASTRASVE